MPPLTTNINCAKGQCLRAVVACNYNPSILALARQSRRFSCANLGQYGYMIRPYQKKRESKEKENICSGSQLLTLYALSLFSLVSRRTEGLFPTVCALRLTIDFLFPLQVVEIPYIFPVSESRRQIY